MQTSVNACKIVIRHQSPSRVEIERWLVGHLAHRLDVPPDAVDCQQPLTHYGLDSLVALELVAELEAWLCCALPLTLAWDYPTIAALASYLVDVQQSSAPREALRPGALPPPHSSLGNARDIIGEHGSTLSPLARGQQALWLLQQQAPESAAYNLAGAVRILGTLHIQAMQRAFQQLVERHAALRTTFPAVQGHPVQCVHAQRQVCFQVEDVSTWSPAVLQEHLRIEAHSPFDLAHAAVFRIRLYRESAHAHVLLLVMHHIIADFWSFEILIHELGTLYAAAQAETPALLPPLERQYTDYVRWQEHMLDGPEHERLRTYWQQQLAGPLPVLHLPTDRPRPPVQTWQGDVQRLQLNVPLTQQLKMLSQAQGTTLYTTLLSAFAVLLSRYTGQEDVLVGSPMACRTQTAWSNVVGYFANPVVLRAHLAGNPTFEAVLRRMHQTVLDGFAHQQYPFSVLVEQLHTARDPSRSPLFQVMFVFQQTRWRTDHSLALLGLGTPAGQIEIEGLSLEVVALAQQTAQFDLTLSMAEVDGALVASMQYTTALFDAVTITRLLSHFAILLTGIVADPQQAITTLPLLSAAERQQMLVEWNATQTPYPQDACLHQLVEAQVERTPERVAVTCGEASLTYRAFNARANQVAHHLRRLGVGPEVLVGLYIERSLAMVIGLLGILKAGGAYVPLDPTYPPERLRFMLEDAHVPVLLTQEPLTARLPIPHGTTVVCLETAAPRIAQECTENPVSGTAPDNLAYVLYTSGSTGQPKGVLGLHRGAVNRCAWMWQAYPFAATEVGCHKTSLNFVDSVWELWGPLCQGVHVVILPHEVVRDPQRLVHTLATHHVTRLVLVPSLLRVLLDTCADLQARLPALKSWISSGEALPVELVQHFQQCLPDRLLLNLYGSSEVSADVTCYDTSMLRDTHRSVPIGRPLANTQIYLLNHHLQPVPVGVPGELYVGGAGLARGYLNRPALTAEKYIPHPFAQESTARLYRTGDLARYLPDGTLEYLGRRDQQVQIRGMRVELGEIEAVLAQHPAVQHVLVIPREETYGDQRLVAYVVAPRETAPAASEIQRFLATRLPDFMLPAACIRVDALPLTPNGKVDRRALPVPPGGASPRETTWTAPRTPLEQQLAHLWVELLRVPQIGIHDNFFALGGHSLLAVQLMSRIQQICGSHLPLALLFQAPTIAVLAAALEQIATLSVIVPLQTSGTRLPLFCFHAAGGQVLAYQPLIDLLGPDQPIYGLQSCALTGTRPEYDTLDVMAAAYAAAIRQQQPKGPYALLGWSMGGSLAMAVAHRLEDHGQQVAFVGLLDAYPPEYTDQVATPDPLLALVIACGSGIAGTVAALPASEQQALRRALLALAPAERLQCLLAWGRERGLDVPDLPHALLQQQVALINTHMALLAAHTIAPIHAPIYVWWAREGLRARHVRSVWRQYTAGPSHTTIVPGNHFTLLQASHILGIAYQLRACLQAA